MQTSDDLFPPTLAAARQRIAAIQPAAYARSRNHLGGAVTRLSPYLTHGIVSLTDVAVAVASAHRLDLGDKLVVELGWRAFFHHVARHRGDAILQSLHAGPRPDAAYAAQLPDDIRQARSGVPAIDQAVRTLYATGWLHNHARLWLASYVVHVRGVHWRAGADWLLAHLLDGDRASNHLSWQWVAGTGSHKPYLFNADNVARYTAGSHAAWDSSGSVVDTAYATLERWACGQAPLPPATPLPAGDGVDEPVLWQQPPPGLAPPGLPPDALAGRRVQLVHPWALAEPSADPSPTCCAWACGPPSSWPAGPGRHGAGRLWPPGWRPSPRCSCGPMPPSCSSCCAMPPACTPPTTPSCLPAGPPPGASQRRRCCPNPTGPVPRFHSSGARPPGASPGSINCQAGRCRRSLGCSRRVGHLATRPPA